MAKKPTKKKPVKKSPKKPRVNKLQLWYKFYTDENNPQTFLNKLASAKAAQYKCTSDASFGSVGYQNFKKLQDRISGWLDDNKFSIAALKNKHAELLETHKTVFQKIKGQISTDDLPENVSVIAEGKKMAGYGDGDGDDRDVYDDGDTLLAINVADPEIQRRALDMAYKVKGEYAAEKKELTGPGGGPIETKMTDFPTEPMTVAAWEELRNEAEAKRKNEPDADDPGSTAVHKNP